MAKFNYPITPEFIREHKEEWLQLGQAVKKQREDHHLSQKVLAAKAGICVQTLRRLETGQYIRRVRAVYNSCLNALEAHTSSMLIEYYLCYKKSK